MYTASLGRSTRSLEPSLRCGIRVVRGNRNVLSMSDILSGLAQRCGQEGAVADLGYFLSKPGLMKRIPVLLLFVSPGAGSAANLLPSDVIGAALVYEYQLSGISTRMFSSNDRSGRSTLIAPSHRRHEFAVAVGKYLLEQGAHIVLMSFRCEDAVDHDQHPETGEGPGALWATRVREIPDFMPLKQDFEQTLAAIGQRTRRNLRYYRRRAEKDLGCVFLPQLDIRPGELLAFNRTCMYSVSDSVVSWRHSALRELEKPLLMGLKDSHGQWLSIVGARRVGNHSEILWQMNRDGFPLYSLSLVMRSFLIEHEVNHGATRFYLEGGSGHPIRQSFVSSTVTDLAVLRRSLPAFMTRKIASRVVEAENELACMLFDPDVTWHSSGKGSPHTFRRDTPYRPAQGSLAD